MAAVLVNSGITGTVVAGGSFTWPWSVVAGNTLIAICGSWYAGCPPTLSDSASHSTWTSAGSGTVGGSGYFIRTAAVTSSGVPLIAVAAGCSQGIWFLAEVSGLQALPFDQKNSATSTTSPCNAGSITPTSDGQFIMACYLRNGGIASTFTSSGTFAVNATAVSMALTSYVQPTAGAIVPGVNATVSASYFMSGICASFKAVVAAGVASRLALMGCG